MLTVFIWTRLSLVRIDPDHPAALADDALERARRRRVELRGDAPGEERLPPCLDPLPHRLGHQDRVPGARDGGVHEHGVAAELERLGGMRRRADAGVDD